MFDSNKSFDENLAAFLTEAAAIDAECAKILSDNIDILIANGPDRDARQVFNTKVKDALMASPDQAAPE